MTSGGDAPGMNAVVRAVCRMALAKGCEPYAIKEGYEGLVQGGNLIQRMSWEDVRGYLSEVYLYIWVWADGLGWNVDWNGSLRCVS